jgi:VanZ family protein
MFRKFLLWLPPILWASLIFYLSSIPQLEVTSEPVWNFLTRKLAHIGEYAILGFLVSRALNWRHPQLALVLSFLYAVSDEWHQTLVPTRTGKVADLVFDLFGIILGVGWKSLPVVLKKLKK